MFFADLFMIRCPKCQDQPDACATCRAFERVRAKYKPRWDARRAARAERKQREQTERESNFAKWGRDNSLPVGDRD